MPYWIFILALCLAGCESSSWGKRGQAALQVGDYARAQMCWSHVLDASPANVEARTSFAMAVFSEAQEREREHGQADSLWEASRSAFRILLRLDSSQTTRALASTTLFQVSRRRMSAERLADAARLLHEAVRLDSTNWFAWNLLALTSENLGQDERAQALYEQILVRQPTFVTAYINLGNLQWRRGQIGEAWESWSLGLEQDSANTYLQQWTARAEEELRRAALTD